MSSIFFRYYFTLSSLLLLSGCIDFRSIPTDDPLVFTAHVEDPDQQYWKPGSKVPLKLSLTSDDEALHAEQFHVLSATLDDGTDVRAYVTHEELTLNEHTLYYTPQHAGDHTLRVRLGLRWEPEGAQETTCQVHVPSAEWRVRGKVNEAGALSFKVDGVADWKEEQWTLLPHRAWSAGVAGTLHYLSRGSDMVWEVEGEETLQYGENNDLQVNLTTSSLDAPQVCFTVQGPDEVEQAVRVDLLPLCVAHLQEGMSGVERNLAGRLAEVRDHVQAAEALYALEEAMVLDPNRNREKVRDVAERLATMERDKEAYDRDIARLGALDQKDPKHASRLLPTFQSAQQRLGDAQKCLRSTQVQLQEQCTTAHEALAAAFRREDGQENIDILLEDPRFEVNELVRDENNLECSLLYAAVKAKNETAARKVIKLLKVHFPNNKEYLEKNPSLF